MRPRDVTSPSRHPTPTLYQLPSPYLFEAAHLQWQISTTVCNVDCRGLGPSKINENTQPLITKLNNVFFQEIHLKMTTYAASSKAATSLINSDLKEIGEATMKLANHVINLGVNGGLTTPILQWTVLILIIPIYYTLGMRSGQIGQWLALIGLGLVSHTRLLRREGVDEVYEGLFLAIVVSPGFVAGYVREGWIGVIICVGIGCYVVQDHIRAGGYRERFTTIWGIFNSICIAFLFVYPLWISITLI
ncbi:hypothetical protein SSX86_024069 [Deinandra increscens subsp. villosa]|uniref:Uncharacterized protein n=1 Tax=Deinandra increscens subsp. villosa TaxID=3103831 RepID=A0AAP0CMQ8_9ASTR